MSQPIERNPAPRPQEQPPQIAPELTGDPQADATPLGGDVSAIFVSGDDDLAKNPRLALQLERFKGQPLSRRLIADIKARIARFYRAAGRPFVSLSVPEQDISTGQLTIIVTAFKLGDQAVVGLNARQADQLQNLIRQQRGDRIDADQLADDLDWINRYPFRRVEAIFSPGSDYATTNVTYKVSPQRPWALGGGYGNFGSPATGMNRAFAYAMAALPLRDSWVSYQLSTSGQSVNGLDHPPSGAKRYVSHSARAILTLWPRTALEISAADIRSGQPAEAFDVRQKTREWGVQLRSSASNIVPALPGEVWIAWDSRQQRAQVLFGESQVRSTAFDVHLASLGYAVRANGSGGQISFDVAVHVSPGGVTDLGTDAAYRLASQGQFNKANFTYLTGSLAGRQSLGKMAWDSTISFQYAKLALPQTEVIGFGGFSAVRGYSLDDGVFDRGFILRNELRGTPVAFGRGMQAPTLTPLFFWDMGWGKRVREPSSRTAHALGAGTIITLTDHLFLSADGAVALKPQGETRKGDVRSNIRITARF